MVVAAVAVDDGRSGLEGSDMIGGERVASGDTCLGFGLEGVIGVVLFESHGSVGGNPVHTLEHKP